jgi:hypothetical protein
MRGAIHSLPQYAFMAWCLVKHRERSDIINCNLISPCKGKYCLKIRELWPTVGIVNRLDVQLHFGCKFRDAKRLFQATLYSFVELKDKRNYPSFLVLFPFCLCQYIHDNSLPNYPPSNGRLSN